MSSVSVRNRVDGDRIGGRWTRGGGERRCQNHQGHMSISSGISPEPDGDYPFFCPGMFFAFLARSRSADARAIIFAISDKS